MSETRRYYSILMVEWVQVEVLADMSPRTIREALYTPGRYAAVPEDMFEMGDGLHEQTEPLQRTDGPTVRIMATGDVEQIDPDAPPYDDCWREWRGHRWALDGWVMIREDVDMKRPRGMWRSIDTPLDLDELVRHAFEELARPIRRGEAVPARPMADYLSHLWHTADGALTVKIQDALFPSDSNEGDWEWRASSEVAPVLGYRDGELVAVVMPTRQD